MKRSARMNVFERYLSLWVAACMVLGVALGKLLPKRFGTGGPTRETTRHRNDRDSLVLLAFGHSKLLLQIPDLLQR